MGCDDRRAFDAFCLSKTNRDLEGRKAVKAWRLATKGQMNIRAFMPSLAYSRTPPRAVGQAIRLTVQSVTVVPALINFGRQMLAALVCFFLIPMTQVDLLAEHPPPPLPEANFPAQP